MKKFKKIYFCLILLIIIAPKIAYAAGNIKTCDGGEIKTIDNKILCVIEKGFVGSPMVQREDGTSANMLTLSDGSEAYSSGPRLKYDSLCSDNDIKSAVKIIGYIILVIKWIVPLIIIVLGMVDFGKAAISNDEKAINKATGALIRRFVAGIVIFFIPTIIMAALNAVQISKGIEEKNNTKFGACTKCLFDPVNECPVVKQ